MKVLYLECNAGSSGDMMLGALSDAIGREEAMDILGSRGIKDVVIDTVPGEKSHIGGTMAKVSIRGHEEGEGDHVVHGHRSLPEVLEIIDVLNVPDKVKSHARAIYSEIAQAESKVHGVEVGEVHFHEVGMLDAIADVVGSCLLIDRISPDIIVSSPLRTGFGFVECAHGKLPIPAPATSLILCGMPSYSGDIEGEFTTPTGAAIVKHFAEEYGQRPRMSINAVGVGIGHHDFEIPNILRVFIGEAEDRPFEIYEINCNIDDMTPEDLGPMIDRLLDEGALDATISPMIMKKGRPGYRLTCLCRQADKEKLARMILANTTTIGLRIWKAERFEMISHTEICHTAFGDIRVKVSEGYGMVKWKPEHDDLVKAAEKNGVSIREVREAVRFEPDLRN